MRVVEIEIQDQQKRYVVIDDTGSLIEPIAHYLKYLDRIDAARQTLRSYAFALRRLFPVSKRSKHSQRFQRGDPREASGLQIVLNHFAKKYRIQDESGNIFHFRFHAFRHTKGVELVNNGMSLVMVQQWMAHVSPEMTLIYARILDETMRTQWEKAVQHGIV